MQEELVSYRHIKLTNGEDIVCQLLPDVESVDNWMVRYPMRVFTVVTPESEDAYYAFMPWAPFTNQDIVPLSRTSIVTVTSIRPDVKDLYLAKVTDYLSQLIKKSTASTEESKSYDLEMDEESDEIDDDTAPKKKTWVN